MHEGPATKYVILGSLMEKPRHGYEIVRFLQRDLGPAWRVSTSQLYALLKRLKQEGLVDSSLEVQDTRPSKRVFSLTPEGREDFLGWIRRPTRHVRDLRIEFLAKLFFFQNLSIKGAAEVVDTQIAFLEQVKQRLMKKWRTEKNPYYRLVFGFRIATLGGWLQWLEQEAGPFARRENTHDRSL